MIADGRWPIAAPASVAQTFLSAGSRDFPVPCPVLPHGTVDEVQYQITLACVRELSEHATLRPAPRKLRCIPVQTFALAPVNACKQRIFDQLEVALLLTQMSREFIAAGGVRRHVAALELADMSASQKAQSSLRTPN